MKKIFTFVVSALLASSAFAQDIPAVPGDNAVGLYRTQIEAGYWSVIKTATTNDITVTPVYGETTKTVDLDNDANIGESTEMPRFNGKTIEMEDPGDGVSLGRIFPKTELSAKDAESYVGFKMSIPEGKVINIDKLYSYNFFGNTFMWCVDVVKDGTTLYTTGPVKVNNYNKVDDGVKTGSYGLGISTTKNEMSALLLPGAKAMLGTWVGQSWLGKDWAGNDFTSADQVCLGYKESHAWGNYLTDAVKNLTGDVEVRLYYWKKAGKMMTIGDLFVEVSPGTDTGISSTVANASKTVTGVYTAGGAQVSSLQKGLNIVKYSNGKTVKVLVK